MNIEDLGWKPTDNISTENIVRITNIHRNYCEAIGENGPVNIYLSGKFQHGLSSGADKPATGDFIKITPTFVDEQNHAAAILVEILPRRSKISRIANASSSLEQILVTNVDIAFILSSVNDDFSINRLQRYILLAHEGRVKPVVVLSKLDLLNEEESVLKETKARLGDVEVFGISSFEKSGLDEIKKYLVKGSSSVFLGSSGVGKSTLLNLLMGKEIQAVKAIREDDSKGVHTTSSRDLFFLENGAMLIDTAGLREVQVVGSSEAVANTFEHVSQLMDSCKFTNCSHNTEPGCSVQEALENGELEKTEWENFQKLQREAAYAETKLDKAKSSNAKNRWKKINQDYKARKKFEGRD